MGGKLHGRLLAKYMGHKCQNSISVSSSRLPIPYPAISRQPGPGRRLSEIWQIPAVWPSLTFGPSRGSVTYGAGAGHQLSWAHWPGFCSSGHCLLLSPKHCPTYREGHPIQISLFRVSHPKSMALAVGRVAVLFILTARYTDQSPTPCPITSMDCNRPQCCHPVTGYMALSYRQPDTVYMYCYIGYCYIAHRK